MGTDREGFGRESRLSRKSFAAEDAEDAKEKLETEWKGALRIEKFNLPTSRPFRVPSSVPIN
jgi:hypothetical protein